MQTPEVSQEIIGFHDRLQVVLDVTKHVEWLKQVATTRALTESDVAEIGTLIKKHINLDTQVVLSEGGSPAITLPPTVGHSSIRDRSRYFLSDGSMSEPMVGTVDLANLKVTGFLSTIPSMLFLPRYLFTDSAVITFEVDEIVAAIFHEVGHQFMNLATLGEYAWINYYLTDGLDVLTGQRPNTHKVELLSASSLGMSKEEVRKARHTSKAKLRQAVISAYRNDYRHQFRSVVGTRYRNEQMADMVTARLGLARPMAMTVYKVGKLMPREARYYRSDGMDVMHRMISALTTWGGVGLITALSGPGWAVVALLCYALGAYLQVDPLDGSEYNRTPERIAKLRRELIAELRTTKPGPKRAAVIDQDIKAIDALLKNMNDNASFMEAAMFMAFPPRRRKVQLKDHEELLESLLNSDLFVLSNRFAIR